MAMQDLSSQILSSNFLCKEVELSNSEKDHLNIMRQTLQTMASQKNKSITLTVLFAMGQVKGGDFLASRKFCIHVGNKTMIKSHDYSLDMLGFGTSVSDYEDFNGIMKKIENKELKIKVLP